MYCSYFGNNSNKPELFISIVHWHHPKPNPNLNWLGGVGSRGKLPCELLAPSAKRVQNGTGKLQFPNFFCLNNRAPFHPLPRGPISLKFEHKTWILVVMNSFGADLRYIFDEGHSPQKNLIFCPWAALPYELGGDDPPLFEAKGTGDIIWG